MQLIFHAKGEGLIWQLSTISGIVGVKDDARKLLWPHLNISKDWKMY